jgi:hypothetical protein
MEAPRDRACSFDADVSVVLAGRNLAFRFSGMFAGWLLLQYNPVRVVG